MMIYSLPSNALLCSRCMLVDDFGLKCYYPRQFHLSGHVGVGMGCTVFRLWKHNKKQSASKAVKLCGWMGAGPTMNWSLFNCLRLMCPHWWFSFLPCGRKRSANPFIEHCTALDRHEEGPWSCEIRHGGVRETPFQPTSQPVLRGMSLISAVPQPNGRQPGVRGVNQCDVITVVWADLLLYLPCLFPKSVSPWHDSQYW